MDKGIVGNDNHVFRMVAEENVLADKAVEEYAHAGIVVVGCGVVHSVYENELVGTLGGAPFSMEILWKILGNENYEEGNGRRQKA